MRRRSLAAALLAVALDGTRAAAATMCEPVKESGKTCPDFGDDQSDVFCCPSTIEIGSYYCCNALRVEQLEEQERRERINQFLRSYLPLILLAVVGALLLLAAVTWFVCLCHHSCPLYKRKRRKALSDLDSERGRTRLLVAARDGGHYKHVRGAAAADLMKPFEAPPPYSHADACPVVAPPRHYELENERNARLAQQMSNDAAEAVGSAETSRSSRRLIA